MNTLLMLIILFSNNHLELETTRQINLTELGIHDVWPKFFHVATSDNGTLCIYDRREYSMLIIDSNDNVLKRFGGRGQGPTDFSWVLGIFWDKDQNSFIVFDGGNNRLIWINEKGDVLKFEPIPTERYTDAIYSNGSIYWWNDRQEQNSRTTLYSYNLEEKVTGKLFSYEHTDNQIPTLVSLPEGRKSNFWPPWRPTLRYSVGSNFIARSNEKADQLIIADLLGKVQKKVRIEKRTPFLQEDFLFYTKGPFEKFIRKTIKSVDVWPPIYRIFVDTEDRIWVYLNKNVNKEVYSVNIFNRSGLKIGSWKTEAFINHLSENHIHYIKETKNDTEDEFHLAIAKFRIKGS